MTSLERERKATECPTCSGKAGDTENHFARPIWYDLVVHFFERLDELEEHLKRAGVVVAIPERATQGRSLLPGWDTDGTGRYEIPIVGPRPGGGGGLASLRSNIFVTKDLLAILNEQAIDENSVLRKVSTRPITRAFVYLDISDFSKMDTDMQLLVVHALVHVASRVQEPMMLKAEAQLCIGDGYIYVWADATEAARFACNLARAIEMAVSAVEIPEFHFRVGAHIGPVRRFWDPGRGDWNYVGDGINGGNRVLSAIGKDTDDVVFVSGQFRSELQKSQVAMHLLPHLHNRGRKNDKHGNPWRVYEFNHSAMYDIPSERR